MSIVVNKTRLPVTEWKTEKASVVSVNDARMRAAKEVVVDINPVQEGSGDPSPTNIRPIRGWSANLFDISNAITTGSSSYGFSTEIVDGYFHVYGTFNGDATSVGFRITTDQSVPYISNTNVYAYDMNDEFRMHYRRTGARFTTRSGGLATDLQYLEKNKYYDFRFKVMITTETDYGLSLLKIGHSKKNLARISNEIMQSKRVEAGITWEAVSESCVHISGTATGTSFLTGGYAVSSPYMRTLPKGTYTISTNFPNQLPQIGYVYMYGYRVGSGATTTSQFATLIRAGAPRTFTLDGAWRVNIQMTISSGATIDQDVWVQIEEGTEATEYEQYSGEEIEIDLFPPLGRNLVDSTKLINATGLSAYNKYGWKNILKNNTTYTYSVFGDNTYAYRLMAGHTKTAVPSPNIPISTTYIRAGNSNTFTTPSDIEDWEYLFLGGSANGAANSDVWFQIEEGDTGTPYEQYMATVYDADIDLGKGELRVKSVFLNLNSSTMNNSENYPGWRNLGMRKFMGTGINTIYRNQTLNIGTIFAINTAASSDDILYLPSTAYGGKTQPQWIELAQDIQIVIPLVTPLVFPITPVQTQMLEHSNVLWSSSGDTSVTYAAIRS